MPAGSLSGLTGDASTRFGVDTGCSHFGVERVTKREWFVFQQMSRLCRYPYIMAETRDVVFPSFLDSRLSAGVYTTNRLLHLAPAHLGRLIGLSTTLSHSHHIMQIPSDHSSPGPQFPSGPHHSVQCDGMIQPRSIDPGFRDKQPLYLHPCHLPRD